MGQQVRVSAPSRVHCGLLRLACESGPSFGGLGLMVDQPRVVVELQQSDTWSATGPHSQRAQTFAQQAWQFFTKRAGSSPTPAAKIQIHQAPPTHSGLGTGTQLALAIARAVAALHNQTDCDIATLAASVGRGNRSAVGSHGFDQGGLIWETGHDRQQSLGQLAQRIALPEAWRIVLLAPDEKTGLHGKHEVEAFAKLPPADPQIAAKLLRLAEDEILPAAEQADFDRFSEAVHCFGKTSGGYFASVQGGLYASPEIAQAVQAIRACGVQGVGQSSWGPTVFAIAKDESSAKALISQLGQHPDTQHGHATLCRVNNSGAAVHVEP